VIVRTIAFALLIVTALATSPSRVSAQPPSAWILWEKTYTTKGKAAPTTMWEPYDGYDTLAECRKAALPLVQYALDYVKSSNGKVLGPVQMDGRAVTFTVTESGVQQTVNVRYLCFPGPFDPRPRN
jgi:hypothetical protein